jgi:hypothetical protein
MYGGCQTALFYRKTDCSLYGELSQTGVSKSLCVVGFEILTAVATKCFISWSTTLCGPEKFNRRFKGNITSVCPVFSLLPFGFSLGILFDPEDGADIFRRKFTFTFTHISAVLESFR